ncbi:hypothetical protein [Streptomyces yunnanensis]|uniref:Uncharacterized protein n=1 Tax=Streptomyces yunnanensis TaxID=156453 RepID=A0A9X8QY74_9ACTN|nr:hypothetical protein [Streptomyces yunnanensis]SHN01293.1 hypothetical protein SAMN05216268_117183 [Streptomyces yunnanensis]
MTDSGKNDPLPVKSKDGAERTARALIDSLASQYGLRVDDKTVDKEFYECFGRDHERATDGRFDLSYAVRAQIPGAEHGKALRPMRKKLEAEGYKILGYREEPSQALMDAKGGSDNLFISVDSYGRRNSNALVFSVETPCFLPPGVKQEQVSAPAPDADPVTPKDPRLALMAPTGPLRPDNPFG